MLMSFMPLSSSEIFETKKKLYVPLGFETDVTIDQLGDY